MIYSIFGVFNRSVTINIIKSVKILKSEEFLC